MADDTEKDRQAQSEQAAALSPPRVAGDSISVGVGEGARHVAAGKNIIQIGSLSIPRWAAFLMVGVLALVAVLVGVVAYFARQTGANTQQAAAILAFTPTPVPTATPVPTVTPTALPFAAAADGETMIVILPFHSTAANDSEPHKKIWRRIQELLTEKMPNQPVTAVIDPNTVLTADQQAEAALVGKRHNASMVIWGEDTGVELIASFLNLREPDFAAADVDIQEMQRTQLANPSRYAEFVTRELPGQLAFLALFAVGQTYFIDGDYAAAIDTIESAVAELSSPNDQDTSGQAAVLSKGLADAYLGLGWLYQQAPADLDAAIANYTQAITLDPKLTAAYYNRGVAYSDKGDLDQAIADYTQAITLDPKLAAAYNNRGNAYRAKGELDQAIADYTQAIELDPQDAAAYYNRGVAYRAKGELDQAIADYTQAITLDPQYADAYYNRGVAYSDKGELDQAIADYTQAITLEPQYADAYNNRGNAYSDKGELDQGIADYTQAITLEPQDAAAYYNRGLAHSDKGELDLAIADYTQAITLEPKLAAAYDSLCWSLALQQKPQQAMSYCEKAVALAEDPIHIHNRGLAHALLGDFPAAMNDFQIFVDWLAENYPDETQLVEQRRNWIESLQRGENPITPDVLEELRK